ncbi:hypothetical protein AAON49_14000 [Pseudotenacibaculum sp. MALMAid0570]|uniref:hypothetical protein n=1 Tax=Pseudotenacibaculum sp. MALMAid0570 TaxID=3143938 RepID=UPI0032E02BE7
MKKSILSIGKALSKTEQKEINGGGLDLSTVPHLDPLSDSPSNYGDNSVEDCRWPFVAQGGRCRHVCDSYWQNVVCS